MCVCHVHGAIFIIMMVTSLLTHTNICSALTR